MRLKKVIIFIPSIEAGGVERNAIWVANEMAARGLRVDVLYVRAAEDQLQKFSAPVSLIQFPCARYPFLNRRIVDAIKMRHAFNQYLKNQAADSTVVLSFQSSIAAIGICRKNNIQIICRLSNHPIAAKYEKNLIRKISEWLKPHFYKKADLVIANSERLALDFAGKIHKKVETIYNPIDFNRVKKLKSKAIEPELQSEVQQYAGKLFVSVGRLAVQKDYMTLVKGVACCKYKEQIKLWIIGEGSERKHLENLILSEKLQNNIRLLGYKSNVYAYMAQADLYIQTSLYEGCPNALIEASATGLPAIATDCLSGPSEVLMEGAGGKLIPIGDASMLGKALDEYIENPAKYKEMQRKTHAGLKRFESIKCMEKYIDIMNQTLILESKAGKTV